MPTPDDYGGTGGRERRNYYRVEARLPVRVRPLDPCDAERFSVEISSPREEISTVADPALQVALQTLERKLDLVLAHLDRRFPQPLGEGDVRVVSLSGCGMAFETDVEIELDDPVLVEFLLPGAPSRSIRALAHPVPVEGDQGDDKSRLLAFGFDVIAEADREAIVRFSHEMQRSRLRERAAASETK
jgi:c-di-GMP-binding flagellar brake protein YcgR